MAVAVTKSPIANDIVQDALKKCSKRIGRKVDYLELSEHLDMNKSSLWHHIKGRRSWVVDRWLITLQALGCLSFQGDHIIISSAMLEGYQDFFNSIEILKRKTKGNK